MGIYGQVFSSYYILHTLPGTHDTVYDASHAETLTESRHWSVADQHPDNGYNPNIHLPQKFYVLIFHINKIVHLGSNF